MRNLMRIAAACALLALPLAPQQPLDEPPDVKLPSGKSQREEIAKADHEKMLEEIARMVKLGQEVETELKEHGYSVLPTRALRKLEDIEKLARKVRGRMRRM